MTSVIQYLYTTDFLKTHYWFDNLYIKQVKLFLQKAGSLSTHCIAVVQILEILFFLQILTFF